MESADRSQLGFSTFLQLERAARHAEDEAALGFTLVNETRRLVSYRQAALLDLRGGRPQVRAVSGVAVLDRNAPMIRWLGRVAERLARASRDEAGPDAAARPVTAAALPDELAREWGEFAAPEGLWCPLIAPDRRVLGALWFSRDQAWSENDRVLLDRLCDAYAHAWAALAGPRPRLRERLPRRLIAVAGLALLAAALAIPVPQSALAPATVVARDAQVVAAPLDGVIAEMAVEPNQPVRAGDLLFRFDDTQLSSRLEVAERSLGVAQAELRRARQGAFESREQSAEIAVLESRVALRQAELAYARELLGYVEVRAERDGIAVFADADDWIGRPVRTGERVLQIADPASAAVRVDLAVADAIALERGAPVELFLDVDPLHKLPARLTSASYEASPRPDGALAYRVEAAFAPEVAPPRIGLHGTAKISGETVPLALYLFRRPLAVARQWLGL
jgi:multidrug resistance efflux pump